MSTKDLKKILKEINKEIDHLSKVNDEYCENFIKAFEDSCTSLKELLKNNSDIITIELNKILDILIDKLQSLADALDKGITDTVNSLLIGIKNIVDNLLISIDRIHKEISNIYIQINKNNPYGCTSFPMYNPNTQTAPIPLAVASDSSGCYKIVKNPQSSRAIIRINEGTVWNDKVAREVPALSDTNIYSTRGLADILRPHQETLSDGYKICRNIYSYADMSKLNKAKFFSTDFITTGDKPDLVINTGVVVAVRNTDYTKINNTAYFIYVIDQIIELPNDGMLTPAIPGINNSTTVPNNRSTSISGAHFNLTPGKHHLDAFILPTTNDYIPYSPRLWTPSGQGEFGEFYASNLSIEYKSE